MPNGNRVFVFGRPGSDYMKHIRKWMGNHKIAQCHAAVNYGLQGQKLESKLASFPQLNHMPIMNFRQAGNKFEQVQLAGQAGVTVPKSWHPREFNEQMQYEEGKYIVKPYYSLGGRGVKEWDGKPVSANKYIQERIPNRRYEMRIHAFAWMDPSTWIHQKRIHEGGEDVLAWNHHNGGKFVTVKHPTDPLHMRMIETMKTLFSTFGYQFGAGDFIIKNPGERGAPLEHYFIEWNLATGWTLEHIEEYYKTAFLKLQDMELDELQAMTEGIYPWSDGWEAVQEGLEPEDEQPQPVRRRLEPHPDINRPVEEVVREDGERLARRRAERHQCMMFFEGQDEQPALQPDQRQAEIEEAWLAHEAFELGLDLNEEAAFNERMEEMQDNMNFCPQCGRPVNVDIFGALPRFCPGCGAQVRR